MAAQVALLASALSARFLQKNGKNGPVDSSATLTAALQHSSTEQQDDKKVDARCKPHTQGAASLMPEAKKPKIEHVDDTRGTKDPAILCGPTCKEGDVDRDCELEHPTDGKSEEQAKSRATASLCVPSLLGKLPFSTVALAADDTFYTPRENIIGTDASTSCDQEPQQGLRPQEEVTVESAECVGFVSVQNNRPYQEDRAKVLLDHGAIHLGMFDGHAGQHTSTYLQQHLLGNVSRRIREGMPCADALHYSFVNTNKELRKTRLAHTTGSTATVVVVDGRSVVCASTGDSPAFIVAASGCVTPLSVDHVPSDGRERERVEAAGGRIQRMGWGSNQQRVLSHDNLSGLAMTRAFGDFNFVGIICDPHISVAQLDDDAMYLVLASDGLTERWSIDGVAHTLLDAAQAGCSVTQISERLSSRAMELGSRDNITVILLDLRMYLGLGMGRSSETNTTPME